MFKAQSNRQQACSRGLPCANLSHSSAALDTGERMQLLTLPTLATSRFAASKMKMTPCLLELAATSSCSAEGGARPPTMLLNCF